MLLPIAIDFSDENLYAVLFPSLPGCNAIGESLSDAIFNATEAAQQHIEILLIEQPNLTLDIFNINNLMALKNYENCVWKLIEIN